MVLNIFQSPCAVVHEDVEESPSKTKLNVLKNTADEYEYVPSLYAYDFAPPSYRVPSHSISTGSSSIQQHLGSLLYQEESHSDISGNPPSYRRRGESITKASHVDHRGRIRTSHKSHWRPSEKEQRKTTSKQQKQRRARRLGSPEYQEKYHPSSSQQKYHRNKGNDSLRDTVERVLTVLDYQSLDSSVGAKHNGYATTQKQQNQQQHLPQGYENSQAALTRILKEERERKAQEEYVTRANRNSKSYETREFDGYGTRQREQQGLSRDSHQGSIKEQHNSENNDDYEDVCSIMSYHPSEAGSHRREDAARDRKRSIERSYQEYLERERSKSRIPKEIVQKPSKSKQASSKKNIQDTKKKKKKKPGFFKRMMGGGKKKKPKSKKKAKQPKLPAVVKTQPQTYPIPQDGQRVIKKYRQPSSQPSSRGSSTTYGLSYSSEASYDQFRRQQHAPGSYQSLESRKSSSSTSNGAHSNLPSNAVRVLPPLPAGHPRMATHYQKTWREPSDIDWKSGHPRIPIPAPYLQKERVPIHHRDYRKSIARSAARPLKSSTRGATNYLSWV
jgi:hypothetical protein